MPPIALSAAGSPASPLRTQNLRSERILVVDDDRPVLSVVTELLREEGHRVDAAETAREALERAARVEPAIVLTDMKMPGEDGLWLLDALRRRHPDVQVVLMTGYGQVDTAVLALRCGAADYLTKPIRVAQLRASVERALERRRLVLENRAYQADLERLVADKTRELSKTYDMTLEALVTALDAREAETAHHSQRVVRMTLAIAEKMGIDDDAQWHIARGALLHDIGKIGVPDHVLLKPGKLTDEEWQEMRRHPEIGARILSGIPFLKSAMEIVLAHQERWDGNGYPRGLKGDEIPLGARIFAVADAVDAILSDRPYRRGRSIQVARSEISRHAGTQFDPAVVDAFLQISEERWLRVWKAEPLFAPKSAGAAEAPYVNGA